MRLARFVCLGSVLSAIVVCAVPLAAQQAAAPAKDGHAHHKAILFDVRSVKDGKWSDANTWAPARVPAAGDRVLVARDTRVTYDVKRDDVLRLVQVVGTLSFARDCDTELNVAVLKVQNSDTCTESGFACDFAGVNVAGEPQAPREGSLPTLEVGTLERPIPAEHTARIRLHYLEGMDKNDAPALVCCSARMELHGAPLSRTWVKLGEEAKVGATSVTLAEPVTGWRVGDEMIVTGARKQPRRGTFRNSAEQIGTEERRIARIEGQTIHFEEPLELEHYGSGEFKSEVANLSRNVIVESADPKGVRGHTMYHAYSRGGISYARFAHLGKEGVLGRYSIHYHLVGDTMRGSQILGAAIVDSHNRWVTIHGTEYLVVRDCVGYKSVGHGYFMEDGTEVYNLLDRNLGVQAFNGKKLPKQVLPFDQNDGAAYWWANGRNTLVHNVACENDQYGYRYDMQHSTSFSSTLPVRMPDGKPQKVDVRTIPIWRFEDNESHTEGLAGMVVAANGGSQPDAPIQDQRMLDQIKGIDWTGPDTRHPHVIRGLKIWEAHYAFRPHSPSMLMENVRIHRVAYGIYRPTFDNQVFRNLHLSSAGGEPFNRGMDDASAQAGSISVDGLTIDDFDGGNQGHPVVHMSDNNLSGKAANHFRNVVWGKTNGKRPVFNRGGSVRVDPFVAEGVPYFIHDYYGPGEHAKIVSTKAADLLADGNKYEQQAPLTGDESVVAKVGNVSWPKLLDPVDDLAPATVITQIRRKADKLVVSGISHDNGEITSVTVNGQAASISAQSAGVADWKIELVAPSDGQLVALAVDRAGNKEETPHRVSVEKETVAARKEPPEWKKVAAPYATAHDKPLEPKEDVVNKAEDHTQFRVEFNGIKDDRVPAFFYVPKRRPDAEPTPAPAILLQYGSGGNKKTDYIVAIGKQFAARGYVVLTIDSIQQGERKKKDNQATSLLGKLSPDVVMHYCGDYSRAVDFLVSRPEVDPERLGYVGISWGAIAGITYVAYDERIKAMSSLVGGGNFLGFYSAQAAEEAASQGSKSSDPVYHVARIAPRPLQFINVTKDQLILKFWAESLHKAAGAGPKVVWLDTDHYLKGLDRAAVCDSIIDFMDEKLPVVKRPVPAR